ncbi:Pre-mRNA-splicing factor 38A [Phytophthora nicotianae]|uniref:Pre-mRNA-splicing factor 38A n=1 Tax=Phytophthora nicotianae TaxID=4792 RepID=A0A0W8C404_PHYNI|nr:Pre-mRNA-splicing factor 38A [Phytophthora nicotianae]
MEDASIAATGSLLPWVRQKASNRYAWLEWVISANLPLSFVEMESTRRYTKLPPVCRNTLRANMEGVTKAVEIKIGNEMPDKFGLLLDGWTHGTEHYLGVFACYETPSVNKRLARLMGIPLVGCASHRLNLAVRTLLEPHEADLEQVQSLMKRLRTLTQAAKLRLKTSLKPKLRQETRWGSTYAMLARYFALREFISADDEDLADLMPSPAANRRLKALLLELADVESVSMKLQSEDLNLLDARDLLDGLLEVKPSFRHYLAPDADIVAAPEFESAVIKVLGGRAKLLSRAEKAALKPFERKTAEAADVTEKTAKVGFADRILKRRKVQEDKSAYSQLNAIPPTSNAAERLFSMARMVLRYERNRLSPLMLEMLLFLKLNSKYWDVTTVDAVI